MSQRRHSGCSHVFVFYEVLDSICVYGRLFSVHIFGRMKIYQAFLPCLGPASFHHNLSALNDARRGLAVCAAADVKL